MAKIINIKNCIDIRLAALKKINTQSPSIDSLLNDIKNKGLILVVNKNAKKVELKKDHFNEC